MDIRIAAPLLAIAVAGGGYAGWKMYGELGALRVEVVNARTAAEQAKTEARVAKEKANDLAKERDELKIMETGLRAERDSARMLFESAQRQNERMAQEMLLAQQQIAYLRARTNVPPSQLMVPQVVQQRPMIIQAIPAPRPQSAAQGVSVGAGVSAPVPGQGYGGRPQ